MEVVIKTLFKLYVDEIGDPFPNDQAGKKERFAMVGLLIKKDLVDEQIRNKIYDLKNHFQNDRDFGSCLHHTDIVSSKETKNIKKEIMEKGHSFLNDIRKDKKNSNFYFKSMLEITLNGEFEIFCVGINPSDHAKHFESVHQPIYKRYAMCFKFLVDLVGRTLTYKNGIATVVIEKREMNDSEINEEESLTKQVDLKAKSVIDSDFNKTALGVLESALQSSNSTTFEGASKRANSVTEMTNFERKKLIDCARETFLKVDIFDKCSAVPGLELVDHLASYAQLVMHKDHNQSLPKFDMEKFDKDTFEVVQKKFRGSVENQRKNGGSYFYDPKKSSPFF